MVLIGQVNPQIVSAINVHGPYAVGVSGEDAGLIRPRPAIPSSASSATSPRSTPASSTACCDEFIPVIATIGTDEHGQAYNINADTVAGAIAEAVGRREARVPDRHRGLRRGRRPGQPDPPDHGRRARRS
jgi:acetylglutamate kinase